ncbi:MAG: adenylate kinase [Chlamydiia bacterium]|nr:adenylate kinase [Chlamydiia bacterium]
MKRIVIIGNPGSGKSTLGRHLAQKLGYPLADLDDLYWLPNWTERPKDQLTSLIEAATSADSWIICGNSSTYRHLMWPKADTIIWLDPPLPVLLWRVIKRTVKNLTQKTAICNGNYETLRRLFGSNSIIYWLLRSYFRHRPDWKKQRSLVTHVKWIYIRRSKDMRFLEPHK